MSNYGIRYNRATNHISGLCEASKGSEFNYAVSACGALSRSVNFAEGKCFEDASDALAEARKAGGRKLCKNCEKAALAQIARDEELAEYAALEADIEIADNAQLIAEAIEDGLLPAPVVAEQTSRYQIGDRLYFIPVASRIVGANISAGPVVVTRITDHADRDTEARYTYVVHAEGVPAAQQGTDANELHLLGEVPRDERWWMTWSTVVCSSCRDEVLFANTKIVQERVKEPHEIYHGQIAIVERRVCETCTH